MRIAKLLIFTLLLSLMTAGPALAHKVNLFAYVEDGKIFTESYFPDGRKVKQGTVEIRDSSDRLLTTGTTDDQGLFNCPIPKVDNLTIIIKASMGHKNSYRLKKAEVEDGQ
ncbi:hypothetical protein C2E25_14095 [Geothermobacter hydrogeniphilus]|uniref:Nickel transport protein n=1 Tax=Geothermobacter hydrogeniphilus TaxID=1969733 RepID=A0A2K2H734_9BACT|nr:hypothetical protein [Geothermobacter hydrogeniphilus]PNU19124.1 hypothetical protein C2E25_14095 [Geothermobacter hydrogeniphilus]